MRVRKCQACRQPAERELCEACEKKFDAMYTNQQEQTTMGKNKTAKRTSSTTKPKTTAPKPVAAEAEPFGGLDMDDEEAAAEAQEVEDVDVTDEVPTGDDAEEEDEATPVNGKTAQWMAWAAKNPKRAAKQLHAAVARLEKFDWAAMDQPNVTSALRLLTAAIPVLEARSAPRATKVSEGDKVQVREKYRGKFTDFFGETDMVNLTVLKVANRTAKCETSGKTEILFPVAALEAQA
jgi:hypothetical protein